MSRRLARETALQVMFQVDMAKVDPSQAIERVAEEFAIPSSSKEFAYRLVKGTVEKLEDLDNTIQSVSPEWNIPRMANVDRNILRLATFELFYCPDIPGNVSVNEAIELAKMYSGEEAGKFVNGVLGVLLQRSGKKEEHKNAPQIVASGLNTEQADLEPVVKGDLQ